MCTVTGLHRVSTCWICHVITHASRWRARDCCIHGATDDGLLADTTLAEPAAPDGGELGGYKGSYGR